MLWIHFWHFAAMFLSFALLWVCEWKWKWSDKHTLWAWCATVATLHYGMDCFSTSKGNAFGVRRDFEQVNKCNLHKFYKALTLTMIRYILFDSLGAFHISQRTPRSSSFERARFSYRWSIYRVSWVLSSSTDWICTTVHELPRHRDTWVTSDNATTLFHNQRQRNFPEGATIAMFMELEQPCRFVIIAYEGPRGEKRRHYFTCGWIYISPLSALLLMCAPGREALTDQSPKVTKVVHQLDQAEPWISTYRFVNPL